MTIEEVLDLASPYKLIRHRDNVFFNTRDGKIANGWAEMGAKIVPHYDEGELERRKAKGLPAAQKYEVHILGACTPIWEPDADGEERNVTAAVLLEHVRARDGFPMGDIRR